MYNSWGCPLVLLQTFGSEEQPLKELERGGFAIFASSMAAALQPGCGEGGCAHRQLGQVPIFSVSARSQSSGEGGEQLAREPAITMLPRVCVCHRNVAPP